MGRARRSAGPGGRSRALDRRGRRALPAVLAAVGVAVLGGAIYLAAHLSAGGPARSEASPLARQSHPPVSASPAPSAPARLGLRPPGQAGTYRVAERRYTFTENPGGGRAPRILDVSVRFPAVPAASPARDGMFPLIVFAPGYRQCDVSYSDLLRQWASAGYVVAAVEFPLTNCHTAEPDESDLPNQPADMAFVIGRLTALSDRPQQRLAGLISASRVAVAGHSDGGDTVAAMAAASCCRYPGLRAVIVLSGAEWAPQTGTWFSAPTPPMLFVQGTADTWNPPAASMQLYQADTTGIRYYLELYGADHFSPYEGVSAPEPVVERVTLTFLGQYLAGQATRPGALRQAGRVPSESVLVSGGRMP